MGHTVQEHGITTEIAVVWNGKLEPLISRIRFQFLGFRHNFFITFTKSARSFLTMTIFFQNPDPTLENPGSRFYLIFVR